MSFRMTKKQLENDKSKYNKLLQECIEFDGIKYFNRVESEENYNNLFKKYNITTTKVMISICFLNSHYPESILKCSNLVALNEKLITLKNNSERFGDSIDITSKNGLEFEYERLTTFLLDREYLEIETSLYIYDDETMSKIIYILEVYLFLPLKLTINTHSFLMVSNIFQIIIKYSKETITINGIKKTLSLGGKDFNKKRMSLENSIKNTIEYCTNINDNSMSFKLKKLLSNLYDLSSLKSHSEYMKNENNTYNLTKTKEAYIELSKNTKNLTNSNHSKELKKKIENIMYEYSLKFYMQDINNSERMVSKEKN